MDHPLLPGLPHRALELFLRLPPLYVMDALLLRQDILAIGNSVTLTTSDTGHTVRITSSPSAAPADPGWSSADNASSWEEMYTRLYGNPDLAVLPHLGHLLLSAALYAVSAFVVTLGLRHLLLFYAYLCLCAALPLAHLSHFVMTDALGQVSSGGASDNAQWFLHRHFTTLLPLQLGLESRAVAANYLCQSVLGLIVGAVIKFHFGAGGDVAAKLSVVSLLSPNLFAILGLPVEVVTMTCHLSLLLPAIISAAALYAVLRDAVASVSAAVRARRQFAANFGLNTFLETEWSRLGVPSLLRTFWCTRLALQLLKALWGQGSSGADLGAVDLGALGRDLLTQGADTMVAVLGMTGVVSSLCHYVGSFFYLILSSEEEEEKSVASVSAVLFFVLALQTGLTGLEPDKRFSRLCKNLCLLLTALFHFVHNMASPVLMGLSAGHNYNRGKHARALFICGFLVVAPVMLMTYLWQSFAVGTWLLAVTAFCIEVIVKVTVTVSVYMLFLYDQYYQEGTWELLDDAVYYVKAAGNSVEFCFAVFLFFNGGWILVFESGGTIRAVMMLIHAYCNIWLEAKSGWQTFMKRRTAVAKINSLPDAHAADLAAHADVCAICYQEMLSAKETRCKHFFHGTCLRKWLYVQDTCPLCHGTLYKDDSSNNSGNNNGNNNGNNIVPPAEVIDNDVHEEEEEANGVNMEEEEEEDISSTSSSGNRPSDNDLIYDSMEDYGDSSSAAEEENPEDAGVVGRQR